MAHGLSIELSKIGAPKWRPVDPAEMADVRKNRSIKKLLSKKTRNRFIKRMRAMALKTGTEFKKSDRSQCIKALRKQLNVQG